MGKEQDMKKGKGRSGKTALAGAILAGAALSAAWILGPARSAAASAPPALESRAAALIKLACIGNSITEGTVVGGNANAYPAVLQKLLGPGYQVQNDGVSSTTMLKSGDTPYWTKGKLANVFAFQPDIVTLKLGTNDTKPQNWDAHKQDFKKDYLAMVDTLAKMASHPAIWLVLPVPVIKSSFGINDTALQKIMVIIKQVAAEKGLKIIDANTPLKGAAQLFVSDGVHPNAAGEDTLGHVFYRALTAPSTALATAPAPASAGPARRVRSGVIVYPGKAGAAAERNAAGRRVTAGPPLAP